MKHLTIDEIIAFVSISELNKASLELASKVNTHIVKCDMCRNKVSAFQDVLDELGNAGNIDDEREVNLAAELVRELQRRHAVSEDKQTEKTKKLER